MSLLVHIRNLERGCRIPPGTCPACAGAVLVLFDADTPDEERAAKMLCRSCGADVSARAKVLIVPEGCI